MLRNKASSSMQKTYDECYLICSTAVYFEGQNNEAEALRSWRSALDQIYYHNAYRVPPNYAPRNETEKALQDSLRDMELQCKERVDLLEALRRSRKEPKDKEKVLDNATARGRPALARNHLSSTETTPSTTGPAWLGHGTVPPMSHSELPRNVPSSLPIRPTVAATASGPQREYSSSSTHIDTLKSAPTPTYTPPQRLPVPEKRISRTPSPDKKAARTMLTTLRGPKDGRKQSKSPRVSAGKFGGPPVASSKAAGLAWDHNPRNSGQRPGLGPGNLVAKNGSNTTLDDPGRNGYAGNTSSRPDSTNVTDGEEQALGGISLVKPKTHMPDLLGLQESLETHKFTHKIDDRQASQSGHHISMEKPRIASLEPPIPPAHSQSRVEDANSRSRAPSPIRPARLPSYRTEFPPTAPTSRATAEFEARIKHRDESRQPPQMSAATRPRSPHRKTRPPPPNGISRRPVANMSSPRPNHRQSDTNTRGSSDSNDENTSSSYENTTKARRSARKPRNDAIDPALSNGGSKSDTDTPQEHGERPGADSAWKERVQHVRKNLPKGVDESAAKQIFNEIVVQGDEVHWSDVAGLDVAKKALKEAVVYPFLRPDLFLGLREPARGMLLFGPPGTGKTMLARAVATESRSTFFAISASSLTSKWLGESEKLVRALFSLAKALAPSIIFVDEIDSLLSSRGGSSEHESTRRIKTEFLIQWSDLQRAAAGSKQSDKQKTEGDASRVLVLAATNMPWAIDEAARRRFVRRQYIPLPEASVRAEQLRTLLGHQKHRLDRKDIQVLVELTDGFSGSDITALAKDAAMGPLRSLGEALLYMSHEEIRPIAFDDFEASLVNIRPSVSKQGLQEFEDWAKEFGERGG